MTSPDPSAWSPRDLVEHLDAAGGKLVFTNPEPGRRAALRRLLHAAKRDGSVPADRHLRHRGRDRGDLVIELAAGPHPDAKYRDERPPRVEVPLEPDRLHPAVMSLLQDPSVPSPLIQAGTRAQALLHAIAVEAEQRGHRVEAAPVDGSTLIVTVGDWSFPIKLAAESAVAKRLPTADELSEERHYEWERIRPIAVATRADHLTIELPNEYRFSGRRRRWADRTRWSLEDKLGEVLAEVEARAVLCDESRAAEEQAAASRQRQWEDAMTRARDRFAEAHRRADLREQVAAWREAHDVRTYCAALEDAASRSAGTTYQNLTDWVAWCRAFAATRDPLTELRVIPDVPEPKPEDLRPFLGRWSPYGPDAGY